MSAEVETLHVPFRRFLYGLKGIAYTYHRPDKPTGGTIGDADFILYGAGSRCLHIEFKDKDTPISAGQKKRHAELAAIGIHVHIIRDLSTAEMLVIEWQRQLGEPRPASAPRVETTVVGNFRYDVVKGELVNKRPV